MQVNPFTPLHTYSHPQHLGVGLPAPRPSEAILAAVRASSMHDPASELRRIPIPRTPVNRANGMLITFPVRRDGLRGAMWGTTVEEV